MRDVTPPGYRLPNGTVPVLLSSDSADLLRDEASALLAYAAAHPEVAPQAIAGMLFRTRLARRYRALAMVADRDEMVGALQAVIDGREHPCVVRTDTPATARRVAYVFPGQGGQRPGMGRPFYELVPAFRTEADRCAETFQAQFGESPLNYLLDEDLPAEDSARTVQPALFTQMAALAAMWRAVGVAPNITIGHSQGEIAAAYTSGIITLADAVRVIGIRAHAADQFASGDYAMAVIATDRDTCEDLLARCPGWAQLSVVNSPNMVGISGDRETVQSVVDTLTERGTFARLIRVQYPAHTSLINELGETVRAATQRELQNPKFLDTEIDCLGSTLGAPITQDLPVDQYWFWNLRNTVRFDKAIAAAAQRDIDTFVELAAHPTLQLAIQDNLAAVSGERTPTVVGTSERTATDLSEFTRNLAQLAVHDLNYPWECLRAESDGPVSLPLLDFPNTRMNETRLWMRYTQPDDVKAVAPAAEPAPEPVTATAPARLLVEEWIRLSQRSLVAPRVIGIVDHTGACSDVAGALSRAAKEIGATAHPIDATGTSSGDLNTLVILMPPSPGLDDPAAATEVAEFFGNRTWWPDIGDTITECWLVTVGGEAVVPDDAPPNPLHAAASSGFRSIATEYLGVAFRHLDLPAASATPESATAILTALHTGEESELAFRDGGLYAKRLVEDDAPAYSAEKPCQHVLITGGTGNLGLEFCDHLARRGAQRITLVSRSGETPANADRLRRIRSSTATQIVVARCDVADPAAVSRLSEQHRDAPADLIIHAAVDYSDIELRDITTAKAEQALRAKVIGIARVLDEFPRTADCRVVLCSSTAATIGGRGQAVYAAANRMLDAMAHRLRADGLDCVSVQWGQWTVHLDLGAAGRAKLAGTGVVPMSPADAMALGMSRRRGNIGNIIVAAFDLGRARSALTTFGYGPLASQLTSPAVEKQVAARESNVSQRFIKLLAEAIGVADPDAIDTSVPMVAIGLDSLQALEFRRRVQVEFNHELNVADILGGASVADVLAQLDTQAAPVEPSEVFQRARRVAQDVVPTTLDVDRLRSARADLDLVGMRAMMKALDPALSSDVPGATHTAENIATQLEFAPRHRWLLRRWLGVLTARGHLDLDSDGGYRLVQPVPEPGCPDLFALGADLGYPRSLTAFMQSCNERLTELAQDRVRVQELLFADGDMVTAVAGYRDNVVGQYLNRGAREVVAGLAAGLTHDRSPVGILELGAGTGGTTDDVIAGLSGISIDYHFTDVSTFFLRAAQERFAAYPQIRYGILDLNTDLPQHDRYDIVLAANVLHNALHIGESLRQLHELINPGGAIVFIETCNANYQLLTSLKFLMSPNPGQPHPGQSDIRAGGRIFLTEDEWLDQLRASGFSPLPVLPDPDHPLRVLDQRLFAALRNR